MKNILKVLVLVAIVSFGLNAHAGIDKTLRFGMRNDDQVKELQKNLKMQGYLDGSADGNFGKLTRYAVMKIQKRFNLSADGVFGKKTRDVFYGKVCCMPPALDPNPAFIKNIISKYPNTYSISQCTSGDAKYFTVRPEATGDVPEKVYSADGTQIAGSCGGYVTQEGRDAQPAICKSLTSCTVLYTQTPQSGTVAGELKVGDCMPQALSPGEVPVDRFSRYNGLAYFISTSNTSIGNLPYNTDFASKFSSIAIYSTFIDNGSLFATNVPFGEYYIMLSSVPNFMDSKVNVESSNSVVSRDIKYCASY